MDLKGSLVDTNIRVVPSINLQNYLNSITINDDVPANIVKLIKGANYEVKHNEKDSKPFTVHLNDKDIENLTKIKEAVGETETIEQVDKETNEEIEDISEKAEENESTQKNDDSNIPDDGKTALNDKEDDEQSKKEFVLSLTTSDIDWLYIHLQSQRSKGVQAVPYLHTLLEGSVIEMPENKVIKRNPVLEARCVKLRAQQEAREYRKMTKTVDNVRMRFPDETISYQLKQLNRQLIVIGQFILSIFAGFLFGFRGVEWMVGNLDFGFRLLLGVMCALVIALAEIYFIAKKLNEEWNIPETIQLGGPTKFADEPKSYNAYMPKEPRKESTSKAIDKEHQD